MTNSPANVIRPRRVQPVRAMIIFGILLLLATIPVAFLLQSANINLPDFGKIFQSSSPKSIKPVTAPFKPALPIPVRGGDSAAYVESLDRAARKLSAEINKSPSDSALQNRLGLIYLTLGDSKSAEQCFINAVSFSRGKLASCASDVEKLKRAGKMADASNVVLEASKNSVELSAAHANLARVYDQRGDRDAVISQLDQLTKDGVLFNGFAAGAGGGKLKSKDAMLSTKDAQLLAQAEAMFKGNQLPAALQIYKQLASDNPKLPFVFDRIGLISVMTGDVSGAEEAWEKAAKLNPNSPAIRNNLGLAYHQMGMDKEAEESFRKALALDPTMEEAALNLGDILSTKGNVGAASAVLQDVLNHNPKSARAANNLGTLLSLSGNYTDAISAFHTAIRINPSMASCHYGMGVALMKTHKYVPAIKELKMALTLNPGLHDAQAKIEEAQKAAGIR